MSNVYLWQVRDEDVTEASSRLQEILDAWAGKASALTRREFDARIAVHGDLLVGSVSADCGVRGYETWCESESAVVLFDGICESILGETPGDAADLMLTAVRDRPDRLAGLEGRYAAVVVDKTEGRGYAVTGATDASTLWTAEGKGGYALGSRAAPLLRLVRRDLTFDPVAAGLYLSFDHLAGSGSLFRHARRLPTRRRVILAPRAAPRSSLYVTLSEIVGERTPCSHDACAGTLASLLRDRVARQLARSSDPILSLSGGKDSRFITAAAVSAGYRPQAYTSGAPSAPDVELACRVTETANLPWIAPGLTLDDVICAEGRLETCRRWLELSEGMECVRHAFAVPDLFLPERPCLGSRTAQVFNGQAGGLYSSFYGRDLRQALHRPGRRRHLGWLSGRVNGSMLNVAREARRDLDSVVDAFTSELAGAGLTRGEWYDLWYWQHRCLQWGSDTFSAKDVLGWHWVPLMDRHMILASLWHVGPSWQKGRLLADAIQRIAPSLAAIPLAVGFRTAAQRRLGRLKRALLPGRTRGMVRTGYRMVRRREPTRASPALATFWREAIPDTSVLDDVVKPGVLRKLLEEQVDSGLLWRAATLSLLRQVDW